MFDISPIQIAIVLAIALLIFGPKRLPDLGRNLGQGIRDFKGGITGEEPAAAQVTRVPEEPAAPTAADLITEAATPDDVAQDAEAAATPRTPTAA